MHKALRVAYLSLLIVACSADDGTGSDTDGGPIPGTAVLHTNADASALCGGADEVRIGVRKVACWDPELPCTNPSDPPWVYGTARPCADVAGNQSWTIEITDRGQYDAQLVGVSGGNVGNGLCLRDEGETPVKVFRDEVDNGVTIELTADPGPCPG